MTLPKEMRLEFQDMLLEKVQCMEEKLFGTADKGGVGELSQLTSNQSHIL
jgi:hypothetical protein